MNKEKESEGQSLLTSLQREYLKSSGSDSNQDRQMRLRIRKRVQRGLHDICHLNQYARSDDIERIFHRNKLNETTNGNQELDGRKITRRANWVLAHHMVALAWRGLRLNGMDKSEIFEKVIIPGIEWGEADAQEVDRGNIESDIVFKSLIAHQDTHGMDPLEKWKRGLALSGDDYQALHDRLSEHPEVDETLGKDLGELINRYLVDNTDSDD